MPVVLDKVEVVLVELLVVDVSVLRVDNCEVELSVVVLVVLS